MDELNVVETFLGSVAIHHWKDELESTVSNNQIHGVYLIPSIYF